MLATDTPPDLTLRHRVLRAVDGFIPASIVATGADALRRARLIVSFSLILSANLTLLAVLACAAGRFDVLAACLVPLLGYVSALVVIRTTASLTAPALILTFTMLGAVNYALYRHGGMATATLFWILPVPMIAVLLGGRRPGLVMLGLSLASMLAWGVIGKAQLALPSSPPLLSDKLTTAVFLQLVLVGLAGAYELMNARMVARLDAASARMRLVLDNIGQGFLLVEPDGRLAPQHAAVIERWFGSFGARTAWWDYVAGPDARLALVLEAGWQGVVDDMLPIEVALDQLPRRLERDARTYHFDYRPILGPQDKLAQLVLVVTDATELVAGERAELAQREQADVLGRALRDRHGFREFFDEASQLVRAIAADDPGAMRAVHTLKGNCALYGVRSVADFCHALETRVLESRAPLGDEDRARLVAAWDAFATRLRALLGAPQDTLHVRQADYDELQGAVREGRRHAALERMLASWSDEPIEERFARIGEQAEALAQRLGKGPLVVAIEGHGVRLRAATWGPFWAAFVHVVRNAVDHGIEDPDERERAHKPAGGCLRLTARLEDGALVITARDDGRGVDWAAVRAKAAARGLPAANARELEAALFADGFSTRDAVTEHSGRGVGLSAVRAATEALGGTCHVRGRQGQDTTCEFRFPTEQAWLDAPRALGAA